MHPTVSRNWIFDKCTAGISREFISISAAKQSAIMNRQHESFVFSTVTGQKISPVIPKVFIWLEPTHDSHAFGKIIFFQTFDLYKSRFAIWSLQLKRSFAITTVAPLTILGIDNCSDQFIRAGILNNNSRSFVQYTMHDQSIIGNRH
ncbi:hypothetical protein SDC9_162063 [bioreactor metagenome]|uniref:Uncharacterized protein n=1 Tax=bioreactor metagenome TaxID=1076179 RepID=A0A645FM48_9ZZZZ